MKEIVGKEPLSSEASSIDRNKNGWLRNIFEKMGELILGSFWASEDDEITEESSLVSGIDKKSD